MSSEARAARSASLDARSGFAVMARLVGLVKPLAGYMVLAIAMGLLGHLCATFITVLGGYALLEVLGEGVAMGIGAIFAAVLVLALLRGVLRYAEQACNHFIAFKLLALIRDKVFAALRRLCPAKLEGRDRGNLINVITSDIELLEVFYAHTISPICIAALFCIVMVAFIGGHHVALGALAAVSYAVVGVAVPLVFSKLSGDGGMRLRGKSGELASFVLDSLRGLPEIIQYGQGSRRLAQMGSLTNALSGGERQRLGLARAFLHDAPFMLLDEPTSNLDSLNEAVILRSLDEESAGKTVVLVSHRRSTMGIADKVYSVERGRAS